LEYGREAASRRSQVWLLAIAGSPAAGAPCPLHLSTLCYEMRDDRLDRRLGDSGFVPLTPDLNQSHAIAPQGKPMSVGGNTVEQ